MSQQSLVFIGAKRNPFGANGGSLKDVNPTDLCVSAAKAALEQAGVRPDQIDHIILGNVIQSAGDSAYTPRHTGLKLGIPVDRPALGINRLCGSGFQVLIEALGQMRLGDTQVALVGGVENMSMCPFVVRGARWGLRMGHQPINDMLMEGLTDSYINAPMAITAENLAQQYQITREQVDQFALRSQTLAAQAQKEGRFKQEIVPYSLQDKKGNVVQIEKDEHMRPETTMESLGKLKPVFKKDGVVTAGNASGIVDGAAMMVVSTESRAQKEGWKPLGRLVSHGVVGCDPKIMGIGPVESSKIALKNAGLSLGQMDLIEVNEAFCAQALAVEKELGIPREKFNINGGATAIGHPLGASGTRITMHLLYELKRQNKRYGLGTACIGGGQGIAVIVEAF